MQMQNRLLDKSTYLLVLLVLVVLNSCRPDKEGHTDLSAIKVPEGFKIEKVVGGLNFPTSIAWDNQQNMYVVEAGGGFLQEPPPARILKVDKGYTKEIINLTARGVVAPVVGLTYHNNSFYITHRAANMTGAVSRISKDGSGITQILSGFLDGASEHPLNQIRMGPDGRMYLAVGPAGNSAVVGMDLAPFVARTPLLHTTSAKDLVLLGKNFKTADFRSKDILNDSVFTGAYVPFAVSTTPGQRIPGTNKPGGSIVSFDPNNAEGTLQTYASGFRNVIGFAWGHDGAMYAAVNGYDVRGSRPVKDMYDATYKLTKGAWYGWPDFSAALEPLTDPKFEVKDELQAQVYINGVPQGKNLGFLIDHKASGLTAPDKSLVVGLHDFHTSPSIPDVAPHSWGKYSGHIFIPEWGDLTPPTDPDVTRVGYKIVVIDPARKQVVPFLKNVVDLPGSEQGKAGKALERPFDVKFGPDGAMYIVDYGQVKINPARTNIGREPYEYIPGTGMIWKLSQMKEIVGKY
ncbi:MAG: hypothetical protein WKF89_18015 [Chitinophagaceae bacterium]